MDLAIVVAVVVVALVFDYTNGFHDAANAIATSVSTRALTPRIALTMAAVMNFVGALLGQEVAHTVSDVISPPAGNAGLVIVLAGLLGAITWNLITWYYGIPSSSSHALIGGILGAAIAAEARPPVALACLAVGLFGVFHGYAHGRELPEAVSPLAYSAGFVLMTGSLHLAGILLGLLRDAPWGRIATRGIGGAIALAGIGFLMSAT